MQSLQEFVSVLRAVKIRPAILVDLSFHVQARHILLIRHRRIALEQPAVVAQNMAVNKRTMAIIACSVARRFSHLILEIPDRSGESIPDLAFVKPL